MLQHYFIPHWISIAFLLTIPIPFVLIIQFLYKARTQINSLRPAIASAIFFIAYLVYIFIASMVGLFHAVSLPPKILLLTTFPYAFLLFVLLPQSKWFKIVVNAMSVQSIIALHIFRFIGVFFILLALHKALPAPFSFISGFGDMLTAVSSLFVVNAINTQKPYAIKLAWVWNIFGTIDIMFTAIAANVLTKLSIDTGSMGVDTLAVFPFCIIPAFAPPTILWLHWIIFKKLKNRH
jgi:hypothetical protein